MCKKYLACVLAAVLLLTNAPVINSFAAEMPEEVQAGKTVPTGSFDVSVLEEEADRPAEALTVSDSDALLLQEKSVFPGADDAEEAVASIDVSDMVYQAGGWGMPAEEDTVALYTADAREQLKEEIWNALLGDADSLDVREYNLLLDDMDDIQLLFAEVLNEHPELFYVQSTFSYSYNGERKVLYLFFRYENFTSKEREAYAEKINQAASLVTSDMTEEEKALVLHDYLAQHCAYAYTEYLEGTLGRNVYNAYGALVEGRAVCQGYALAYNALLRTVGLEDSVCSSAGMNHAWNVVLVDGEWYHVDVTWDDPVWNTEGRAGHTYFLLSDTEIKNRKHYDWTGAAACASEKYDAADYWWNAAESRILLGDKQYYIESLDRGFQLTEKAGETSSAKYVNNTVWEVWGDASGYWPGSFAYLSGQGDYLYFNDKLHLYAMKLTDSVPQVIYTYEGGDGYLYGAMVYEDGTARLNIAQSPNRDSDSFITVDLKAETPELTVDYETGTISTTADMEYSMDNGATWNPCTENRKLTDFGWSGSREVTVSFRTPATGGRFASEAVVITLKASPGTLHGSVSCFGDMTAPTTIQLIDSSHAIAAETTAVGSNAEYVLENVEAGSYTLRVSKPNHVTREYSVTAGGEAVTQDVELHFQGDINGDGAVNAKDKKLLYNHIAGIALLEDYDLTVGDMNEDGAVNAKDKKLLYNHIAGIAVLWK